MRESCKEMDSCDQTTDELRTRWLNAHCHGIANCVRLVVVVRQ